MNWHNIGYIFAPFDKSCCVRLALRALGEMDVRMCITGANLTLDRGMLVPLGGLDPVRGPVDWEKKTWKDMGKKNTGWMVFDRVFWSSGLPFKCTLESCEMESLGVFGTGEPRDRAISSHRLEI